MTHARGKVWFVGAGPGDPELITVKGRRIIAEADLVLYAGSLVPPETVQWARPEARVVDSAPLSLPETHALLKEVAAAGGMAARVHTGDPSLFGALPEQIRLLDQDGIDWEIVPGVTAAFAAAARAGVSFTIPERRQSLIITRQAGRTPVPESESLDSLARHDTAMAVYLSTTDPEGVRRELLAGGLKPETRVVIGHRVGWPDERILDATIKDIPDLVRQAGFKGQAVFLILPGESRDHADSKLYDPAFSHGRRTGEDG